MTRSGELQAASPIRLPHYGDGSTPEWATGGVYELSIMFVRIENGKLTAR
jgi:hypothetical protein